MKSPALPPIWLLATIALASPFAMNVFNPAMPAVVHAFNSKISTVQLTMTLYLLTLGFSQLLSGALADRWGRRPLMLGSMFIHLTGTLLAATAPGIEALITGRVLQALGGGATLVLVRAIILDTHERDQAGQLLSYITMSVALAQIAAPTLGGYLNYYFSWRAIFYFSFSLNLAITVLMFRQLTETATTAKGQFRLKPLLLQYVTVLKSRVYLGYALTGALVTSAYLGFASIMPYIFVNQMAGHSAAYGNWFLFVALGFFMGSLSASQFTEQVGLDKMIRLGLTLALTAATGILLAISIGHLLAALIFIPMGLVTFGRGLLQPNAQSGAISSQKAIRGTASGVMGFIQLMSAATTSQLMPFLLELGVEYVFITILGLLCLAAVAHWTVFLK